MIDSELKSQVYIRDKGICWTCNESVLLEDYIPARLVDSLSETIENVVTMHRDCAKNKPTHYSYESAIKWKLSNKKHHHIESITMIQPKPLINQPPIKLPYNEYDRKLANKGIIEAQNIKDKVLSYFKQHPDLLIESNRFTMNRSSASRKLAYELDITTNDVRDILRDANMVKPYPRQTTDGSQYWEIYNNLDTLIDKYKSIIARRINVTRGMNMSIYRLDIFLYLAGWHNRVSKKHFNSIKRRVTQLDIPIRKIVE